MSFIGITSGKEIIAIKEQIRGVNTVKTKRNINEKKQRCTEGAKVLDTLLIDSVSLSRMNQTPG